MKPESLDALLIDRSLGELTPESEELLQDLLERDPAAARRGEDLGAMLARARQAVAFDRAVRMPAVGTPARRRGRPWHRLVLFPEMLKLAACVVLGVAGGWYVHGRRAPGAGDFAAPLVAQAAVTGPQRAGGKGAPGFWSLAYLEARQRERPAARPERGDESRIPWDGLVK